MGDVPTDRVRVPAYKPFPSAEGLFPNPFSEPTLQLLSLDAVERWKESSREKLRSGELEDEEAVLTPLVEACFSAFKVLAERILIARPEEDLLDVGLHLAGQKVIELAFYIYYEVHRGRLSYEDKHRFEKAVYTWSIRVKDLWRRAALDGSDAAKEWWEFSSRKQDKGPLDIMSPGLATQVTFPCLFLQWFEKWNRPEWVEEALIVPPVQGSSEDEIKKRRDAALESARRILASPSQREQEWSAANTQADSGDRAAEAERRRRAVDDYIEELFLKTQKRILRTDFWKAAGYESRTQFERWERNSPLQTKAAGRNFTRLLSEKPHLK